MVSNDQTLIKLANIEDIPDGEGISVNGPNGLEIALYNINGEIFALNNECPHMGGPLGEGDLENKIVTCPWHGWQFDVKTGECQNMPGEDARCIDIMVKEGEIFLVPPWS